MIKYNRGNVKLRECEVKSAPYPCEEMILWPNPLVLFNLFLITSFSLYPSMVLDLKLKECKKQKVVYVNKALVNSSDTTKEDKEEEREEIGTEGM